MRVRLQEWRGTAHELVRRASRSQPQTQTPLRAAARSLVAAAASLAADAPSPLLYFLVTTKLEPKHTIDTPASRKPVASGILRGDFDNFKRVR